MSGKRGEIGTAMQLEPQRVRFAPQGRGGKRGGLIEHVAEIRKMLRQDLSTAAIGAHFGVTHAAVYRIIKKMRLVHRPRRGVQVKNQ